MVLRLFFSVSALGLGAIILLASLATPQKVSSDVYGAQRQLYLGEEVLPDHVLYPALMAMDRMYLDQAEGVEKLHVQIQYAFRRLDHAEKLVRDEQYGLANTTLTKAQKYLNHAMQASLEQQASKAELQYVYSSYQAFYERVEAGEYSSSTVDSLKNESHAIAMTVADHIRD